MYNIIICLSVIMDGNRRYGRSKYGSITRGHWDGSKTLVDFSKWCLAEGIKVVTVYAFSTENWNRGASEVSALMNIFCKYCDELRVEAVENGIRLQVLSTETDQVSWCGGTRHSAAVVI
jgi:undecaprenyl diphosphate synthase